MVLEFYMPTGILNAAPSHTELWTFTGKRLRQPHPSCSALSDFLLTFGCRKCHIGFMSLNCVKVLVCGLGLAFDQLYTDRGVETTCFVYSSLHKAW